MELTGKVVLITGASSGIGEAWVTATEFHESLRAGRILGAGRMTPHSPEHVARAIVRAIRSGEAEIVLAPGPERPEDVEAPTGDSAHSAA